MSSRNVNERFALNPVSIDIQRSKFNMPHEVKTSFNVGELIPFEVQEVLPGDTFKVRTSKVVRMQPLISAPMDNLYLDTYYFFVPNRIVWNHWKEFMGENTESAWIPSTEYTVPQIVWSNVGPSPGSIADYMGLPTKTCMNVSALPFRAYALICNEWFRNENLVPPLNLAFGDTDQTGAESTDANYSNNTISVINGGAPFKVSKFRDYFTSCLPGPQKGPDVSILNQTGIPVYFGDDYLTANQMLDKYEPTPSHLAYENSNGYATATELFTTANPTTGASVSAQNSNMIPKNSLQPLNWLVDMPGISINALRLAFQVQKLYEKEARSGSRYVEILKGHFNVTAPDASLQRPQYLGGAVRIPIQINQVLQTSESGTTPQGNVAGYSITSDVNYDFEQSFTEHGFIIGVMCARYQHTYQQGINKMWSRQAKLQYYFPVLANIGEEPVYRKEIYNVGYSDSDESVFGYNEAWASYRYKPNIVTGEMRSNVSNSLDSWHFADDYSSTPYLSESWICEDKSNVDRVLAVQSSVSNQLFADILVDMEATRPMPLYSIPGLIDHH